MLVECFLSKQLLISLKKNLTTVFNFLGKITPFQRENDQYYVYKHDVNLISVPIKLWLTNIVKPCL